MPKVTFKSPLAEVGVDVPTGTTLLDAAEQCGAQVGHSCGGVCGCSTCHIWVRKGLDSLSEQTDAEADRLDMGFDVRPYSRLSCQTELGAEDIAVEITEESLTAFMDENPVIRRALEAEGKWPLKK
ncbi:(2Fe-2S)-binding protein [Myxococcus sp. K15C18031901]|uniref:2Fe-2S iron-sulfur cluster-binding protein n=1 Tax=Myxococcus dinghuensis TaxID=2906761 RepID=UPI0020A79631|nr:2Fe-2S iron-sulfur cluster-binding protein [Myxococcus dinghuensis]MCP3100094.1 (2Fe-2S)-binding protein [Myxococcus dinghuensis]